MIRALLTILLPIALPILLYLAYVKLVRPQPTPGATPGAAPGAPESADPASRQNRLTLWILLGVCALLVAGMLALGLSRGVPPGTKLIAPHMEDGKIVPSQRLDPAP